MNWTEFNVNNHVRVKLNDIGYQRLAILWNELAKYSPSLGRMVADDFKKEADSEGYTDFQMWDFMQTFGPTISQSGPMYFEPKILIESK